MRLYCENFFFFCGEKVIDFLHILVVKFLCFFLLPLLVIGRHEGIKGIEMIDCETCEMHTDIPAIVHTDGELFGEETDIEVSCKVAKLHMMM